MSIQWQIPPILTTSTVNFTSAAVMPSLSSSASIFNYSKACLPYALPLVGVGLTLPFFFGNNYFTNNLINLWSDLKKNTKNTFNTVKNAVYNVPAVSTTIQNADYWKSLGYNPQKGQALAKQAAKGAAGDFLGYCATYVKRAINAVGLGKYISCNGCDMANVYGNNKNFKKISGNGIDVKKLPAGCVLVYEKGKSGYSKTYGHTEITLGDGTAVSDGRTRNIRPCSYVLIPV